MLHQSRRSLTIVPLAILLSALPSCAARSRLSGGGLEHLTEALRGRDAVLSQPVIPQNRHAIPLMHEKQPAGTEVRIVEVVVAPGWNGIGFTVQGGRVYYLPVGADDIAAFETELSHMMKLSPVGDGDTSEVSRWLQRTGHVHPPDHLIVIFDGTPLAANPEPGAPVKATLISGDRLAVNVREKRPHFADWHPVITESGEHGWVSDGLVYGPVYLNGPKDLEISGFLSDSRRRRNSLDRELLESADEMGLSIDPDTLRAWPWSVKESIHSRRVIVGMTPAMVRLAIGEPSAVEEESGRETWRFRMSDESTGTVSFRSGRVVQIEGIEP